MRVHAFCGAISLAVLALSGCGTLSSSTVSVPTRHLPTNYVVGSPPSPQMPSSGCRDGNYPAQDGYCHPNSELQQNPGD